MATRRDGAERNAAIFTVADSFDPASRGINGRRVAGESFLRGFFRHAEVREFVSFTHARADQDLFRRLAGEERPGMALCDVPARLAPRMQPVGTLFYPSPNFAEESWRRAPHGASAWSICGITHTISSKAAMQGFFDLRMAAQAEWDAVICTSRAVQAAVLHQFELADDHIRRRFRANPPPRPQLPVIPLGVDSAAFRPDRAAGAALRQRLGLGPADVAFACIARLTPFDKFDPLPLFIALAEAQARLAGGARLHLVLCGLYRDGYSRKVFEEGAARLMPEVGFHVLDGGNADERRAVLSGSDVFVFPIDNIQETFGLAPVEAMAAGLPVLVSDWDGLRDTVTPDCGILVPTRTLASAHAVTESMRHFGGTDNYSQYCGLVSAMTEVDMGRLTGAIVALASDPDLRKRLGEAGRKRAKRMYDWSVVVPQMQDLWEELTLRRTAAGPEARAALPAADLPVAPSPFAQFARYPTRRGGFDSERFRAVPLEGRPDVAETFALRDYVGMGRLPERPEDVAALLALIAAADEAGIGRAALAEARRQATLSIDRQLVWLLKYGFIRILPPVQSRK